MAVEKIDVQEEPISETIPLEWLPKPKVVAKGFDGNNTLTFAETEKREAKLNLDLASALQDIKFKFDFEDEQFSFEDREYLLSTDKETIEQAFKRFFGYDRCAFVLIDLFAGNLFKTSDREDNRCTLRIRCQQITAATVFAVRADRTFQIKSVTPGSSGQTKEKIQYGFILLHCAPSLSIYYFLKKIPRIEEKRQTPNDVCRQF